MHPLLKKILDPPLDRNSFRKRFVPTFSIFKFLLMKKPVSPCRLLMKLKGIYYSPRKKMMMMRIMIKAVVRKVKQKSLLS